MNRIITRTMCILLALVLMSSSAVSFTYAEYARGAEIADSSRSTRWGVTVDVTGGAFATKYVSNEEFEGIDVSVKSSNTDNILAPGTTGAFTGISCTGSPEVSVEIVIDANLQLANWVADGKFYCPLVITIDGKEYSGLDYNSSAAFETAIENAIKSSSGIYPPNTNLAEVDGLNGDYQWYWAFDEKNDDGTANAEVNDKDTALQGKATIALSVGCTVYQVGEEPPSQNKDLDDDDDLEIGDGGPIIWF